MTEEEWKNRYKELSNNYEEMMYKYNKLGELVVKVSEDFEKLKEENEQLKARIEKMKCCGNCKYEPVYDEQGDCLIAEECNSCFCKSNWELAE